MHSDWVRYAAWNGDSSCIATASDDSTARVWDPDTGAEHTVIPEPKGAIRFVAWNSQNTRIVATGVDGAVIVALIPSDSLLAEACDRVERNMSTKEWQEYMGDQPYRKTCPSKPMLPGDF